MALLWVVIVSLVLFSPSTLMAHASLVKSFPARRATLLQSPTRIQLWFSERLEARYSSIAVIDSSGKRVDVGEVEVGADDLKRISVSVGPLSPGLYKIKFRVLSVDGHVVEDEFPFTIREIRRTP